MFGRNYVYISEKKPKKKRNKTIRKILNVIVLLLHSRLLRYGILFGGLARIIWLGVSDLIDMKNIYVIFGCAGVWFIWDLFASAGYDTGDYIFNTIDDEDDEEDIVINKEEPTKELEKEKISTEGSIIRDYKEIAKEKSKYVSLLELVEKYKKLNRDNKDNSSETLLTLDIEEPSIGYSYIKK